MTDKLTDLRRTINQLDDQILDLISRRMTLASDIIAAKQGGVAFRPGREAQVIERLAAAAPDLPRQLVANVWRQLMTASTVLQDDRIQIAVHHDAMAVAGWHFGGLADTRHCADIGEVKAGLGAGATLALVPESLEQDLAAWLLRGRCVFYRGANAVPSVACLAGNADDRPRAFGRGCRRGHACGATDSRRCGSRPAAGPDRGSGGGRGRQTPGDRRDRRAKGTGEPMTVIYEKLAVIGIGLIGSSVALAARRAGAVGHIVGCDADPAVMPEVEKLELVDSFTDDAVTAVADADLVVMAVPVGAVGALAAKIIPAMKDGAVLTDTGSTKRSVIRDVAPHLQPHVHWLPSHPLAGTEHSGPAAGFADLFTGRYWLLIPGEVPEDEVARFENFVTAMGSVGERMDADYHDKVLALTSHLPHLIAYTIVSTAVDLESQLKNDVIRFSASGFRDFTRIAASDPDVARRLHQQ